MRLRRTIVVQVPSFLWLVLVVLSINACRSGGYELVSNGGFELDDKYLSNEHSTVVGHMLLVGDTVISGWEAFDDNPPEYRTITLAYDTAWLRQNFVGLDRILYSFPKGPYEGNYSLEMSSSDPDIIEAGTPNMMITGLNRPMKDGHCYCLQAQLMMPYETMGPDTNLFPGVNFEFYTSVTEFRRVLAGADTLRTRKYVNISDATRIQSNSLWLGYGKHDRYSWIPLKTYFRSSRPYRIMSIGLFQDSGVLDIGRLKRTRFLLDSVSLKRVKCDAILSQ